MRHDTFDLSRAVHIRGGTFRFRTLNPPVGREYKDQTTLDKVIEITLPLIEGQDIKLTPSIVVDL